MRGRHPLDDLDQQIREHLEQATQDYIDRGLSPGEARRAAFRKFGSVTLAKEEARAVWIPRWLDQIRQDAAYGLRTFRRNPAFAVVALLSLALGIGANATIFRLIDAVALQPLPVARAGELADIRIVGHMKRLGIYSGDNAELTFPLWEEIRPHREAFSGLFAWGGTSFLVGTGPDVRPVNGLWMSGEAFPVLGLTASVGRLLGPADDQEKCSPVAVLSDPYWHARYGGDPTAVGRTLTLLGHPVPIVGVTPPGFVGLEVGKPFDVALPACAVSSVLAWSGSDAVASTNRRDWYWLSVRVDCSRVGPLDERPPT